MAEPGATSWRNPWVRWQRRRRWSSLTVLSMLVGFVWLPSAQADFSAQGLWASICRAAGVPASWGPGGDTARDARPPSTDVVLERAMARAGDNDAIGRGATLALNCTMCHGAHGMSALRRAQPRRASTPRSSSSRCTTTRPASAPARSWSSSPRRSTIAAIADLAAYYAYAAEGAHRPDHLRRDAAGAGAGRRPDAQHRAVHLLPRRHRPEVRHAVARRHAARATWSPRCRPSPRAPGATTRRRRCATWRGR